MAIAIITQRSFILCESINYMTLDSVVDYEGDAPQIIYEIHISYNAIRNNGGLSSGNSLTPAHVSIKIFGEQPALKLFKELLSQVRDQCPDQPYLDKMVEEILLGNKEEIRDDPYPVQIRSFREKEE